MSRILTSSAFFAGALLLLSGCGGGKSPVKGQVTIDGKPLPGATVVFTSEDGANTASGLTDDAGNFDLSYNGKTEVPNGSYKVTVTKSKIIEGQSPAETYEGGGGNIGKDYLKSMKAKDASKSANAGGGGGPLMPGMPGYRPGASTSDSGSPIQTELPKVYSDPASTPFTVKVPAEGGEVKLDLKSKP